MMRTLSRSRSSKTWVASGLALLGTSSAFAAPDEVSVTDPVVFAHHYQFGLRTTVRAMQGSFDPYGGYQAFAPGSTALSLMCNFNAAYRFSHVIEAGLSLPVRRSLMSFPTGSSNSWSINSPSADLRLHLGGWPHWLVHIGGAGPWKARSSNISGDPGASMPDDMGDGFVNGAWVRLGVGVSRTVRSVRFAFDVSVTHPFANTSVPNDVPPGVSVPAVTIRSGDRLSLSEGVSYLLGHWTFNGGLRQYWAGPTLANGSVVEGTRARAFSSTVGASFVPAEDWRLNASFDTPFPFYSYAVNLPYAPSMSLGISYVGI